MGCASSGVVSPVVASAPSADFFGTYSLGHKIGRGSYAQVYVVRKSKKLVSGGVAVKIRNLRKTSSPSGLDRKACRSAYKEVCLWSHVGQNCHCVNMYESFFDDHLCYMVMERCNSGLFDHIESLVVITEISLSKVFYQMLLGINHIHGLSIVHRDIKPDNFLVGGLDGKTVKLADFGMAAYVPPSGKAEGVCGTTPFMCPEMLLRREVDLKADVWSFGVIAYSFMCGHFPYSAKDGSSKSMKLAIAEGAPPKCRKPWLTSSACTFLKAVLRREPAARLSAISALRNPFITISCQSKYDSEVSLRGMLAALGQTGLFDPPSLARKSTIDNLCDDIEKGRIERKTRALTQSQIDEFIGATSDEIDQFVESFWFPSGKVSDFQDDGYSSGCQTAVVTQYHISHEDDSSSKTTAYANSPEDGLSSKDDTSSKATAHDKFADGSKIDVAESL